MTGRPSLPSLGAMAWLAVAGFAAALLVVTGLGAAGGRSPIPVEAVPPHSTYAVADPSPLRVRLRVPALLVVSDVSGARLAAQVRQTAGVAAAERVGVASLPVLGRSVTAVAVDPETFRRLTPPTTAGEEAVWVAVARGDAAVSHAVVDGLRLLLGDAVPVGTGGEALRLGAIATALPGVDLVVNRPRGTALGLPRGNGVVVSLHDGVAADRVRRALARSLGRTATVTVLGDRPDAQQLAATLVGGDVAAAVGSFSYEWYRDGTVQPDPDWVADAMVTDEVPILGTVTCHRVMLPALRGALGDLHSRGLADRIDPADFGGCYAPRFIDRDPQRGLSLHTWGIAVDLNVSGNQVGTAGTLGRRVVEVFERWGFAWGGHWRVPDPMHFELARLVTPP